MIVVTDNGSSMVAAFRKYVAWDVDEEEDDKDAWWHEDEDTESECDEDDSDDRELEHDIAFISMKRIGCFCMQFSVSR